MEPAKEQDLSGLWGREEPVNDLGMIKAAAEYGLKRNPEHQ
jgi:hypothetical protein